MSRGSYALFIYLNGEHRELSPVFIVQKDVYVAYGIVENNRSYGPGGYEQFFIADLNGVIGVPSNIYDLILP